MVGKTLNLIWLEGGGVAWSVEHDVTPSEEVVGFIPAVAPYSLGWCQYNVTIVIVFPLCLVCGSM